MMLGGLFEQRDEPVNFASGVFVSLIRIGGIVQHSVYENGKGLRYAIKDEQLVGDKKIHYRGLDVITRRSCRDRLNVMNEFVSDEADCATGKSRQSFDRHGAILLHHLFHYFQTVSDAPGPVGSRADRESFGHSSILENFDGAAVLANDRTRVTSHK